MHYLCSRYIHCGVVQTSKFAVKRVEIKYICLGDLVLDSEELMRNTSIALAFLFKEAETPRASQQERTRG